MSEQERSKKEDNWVNPREQQLAEKATDVVLEAVRPAIRSVLAKAIVGVGRLRDAVVDRLTS